MGRLLQARIDEVALLHNVQQIRQLAPGRSILAMVKANAYGHGIIEVGKLLDKSNKVDALGVACIEEALALRQAEVKRRIVLCEGFFSQDELVEVIDKQLEIVLHNHFQLEILEKNLIPIKLWLKIDTGMNRLGFKINDIIEVIKRIQQAKHLTIIGFMTHFSNADSIADNKTNQQFSLFKQILQKLKLECLYEMNQTYPISAANSAAILAWPQTHGKLLGDWIRPGIMLYGVSPFVERFGKDFNLRQVMTLETDIIAIKKANKGETIGYGSRFICPEEMLIGVIAIGYGDGYTAKIPDGTPVMVNQKRAKIVGKISMDMATIDLRGHDQVKVGDKVILWGTGLPVEEIANYTGIMAYELLTSLGTRVVRYKGSN